MQYMLPLELFDGEDENVTISGAQMNAYDRAVMDCIYTLLRWGYQTFTPEMVIQVLFADPDRTVGKADQDKARKSVEKLCHAAVSISGTDGKVASGPPPQADDVQVGEIDGYDVVDGYCLLEKPVLRELTNLQNL